MLVRLPTRCLTLGAVLLMSFAPHVNSMTFTAENLAAEEAKFAAHSVQHGMMTAFRAFFAERSTLLRPDPVDAQQWMKDRPNPPIELNWRSQFVVLSSSGDLGLSTGPWTRKAAPTASNANNSSAASTPVANTSHGQFYSIWQRQTDGSWKVLYDHGISHAAPTSVETPLRAITLTPVDTASPRANSNAEEQFRQSIATKGTEAAYRAVITRDTRLLREGHAPFVGDDASKRVREEPAEWRFALLQSGLSTAGDFAYALGRYESAGSEKKQRGYYIRAWFQPTPGSPWMLAAEIMTPAP